MELVNLRVPVIINDQLRYPAENPITVSDTEAESLRERELLTLDADADLDEMKVDDLKMLAGDRGIDLGEAKSKRDIIAAIRSHNTPASD